jgi:hypothetical protein
MHACMCMYVHAGHRQILGKFQRSFPRLAGPIIGSIGRVMFEFLKRLV